jgi:hypothetical protein
MVSFGGSMGLLTTRFPPGTGGGEAVAHGRKGQGSLIHSLTEAGGMPLATCTTPANGNERGEVLGMLDAVTIKTGQCGRPRKRLKVLMADQGYDARALRQHLRKRGIRAQIPKRVWKATRSRGRPITMEGPRFQAERTCSWFQKKDRRLAVRWGRLAACFNAFMTLAAIHIWIQKLRVG